MEFSACLVTAPPHPPLLQPGLGQIDPHGAMQQFIPYMSEQSTPKFLFTTCNELKKRYEKRPLLKWFIAHAMLVSITHKSIKVVFWDVLLWCIHDTERVMFLFLNKQTCYNIANQGDGPEANCMCRAAQQTSTRQEATLSAMNSGKYYVKSRYNGCLNPTLFTSKLTGVG